MEILILTAIQDEVGIVASVAAPTNKADNLEERLAEAVSKI